MYIHLIFLFVYYLFFVLHVLEFCFHELLHIVVAHGKELFGEVGEEFFAKVVSEAVVCEREVRAGCVGERGQRENVQVHDVPGFDAGRANDRANVTGGGL